jgi:hypothetical protein
MFFFFSILRDGEESAIYSNLTGRSLVKLDTGIEYMCVCYVYKLGTMLLRTMKNREDTKLHELTDKEHHPTIHVLDNECSHTVKYYIVSERTDIYFLRHTTTG